MWSRLHNKLFHRVHELPLVFGMRGGSYFTGSRRLLANETLIKRLSANDETVSRTAFGARHTG